MNWTLTIEEKGIQIPDTSHDGNFDADPHSAGLHTTVNFITHKLDDESYEGGWSLVHDPMVIFSDHNMDGNTMSNNGGAIAGTAGGVPVQLVFWGGWWNTNAGTRAAIEAQTQRLLASRYFSQLTQYGIPHAPVWRG